MTPVRFSSLKWFGRSAAHYRYALEHPPKQTKPMLLGDALDALYFKSKEVLTFDGASRRTKAWTTFADENPESVLLLPPEREHVDGMLAALQAHPEAVALLHGQWQKEIHWTMSGRECQGTPDVCGPTKLVELKTTINSGPYKFVWDARSRAYHAQLAWYWNGLHELKLIANDARCWIVAVESTPPYPVTIFRLEETAFLEGAKMWRSWFEQLLVCEATDCWPAYSAAVVPFDVPESEGITLRIGGEETEIEGDVAH